MSIYYWLWAMLSGVLRYFRRTMIICLILIPEMGVAQSVYLK